MSGFLDTAEISHSNSQHLQGKTIADNAPLPGAIHESSSDWHQNFNNHLNTRSVFYKGPLLSIIPAFVDLVTLPNLLNIKIYKKDVKICRRMAVGLLFDIQHFRAKRIVKKFNVSQLCSFRLKKNTFKDWVRLA